MEGLEKENNSEGLKMEGKGLGRSVLGEFIGTTGVGIGNVVGEQIGTSGIEFSKEEEGIKGTIGVECEKFSMKERAWEKKMRADCWEEGESTDQRWKIVGKSKLDERGC